MALTLYHVVVCRVLSVFIKKLTDIIFCKPVITYQSMFAETAKPTRDHNAMTSKVKVISAAKAYWSLNCFRKLEIPE